MNNNAIVLAGMLFALAGSAAQAQTSVDDVQPVKPTSIRLGIYLPQSEPTRAISNTWFAAGVDYVFTKVGPNAPALPVVYLDYTGDSKGGTRYTSIGAGVGARVYGSNIYTGALIPYFNGGVGIYFLNGSGLPGSSNLASFGVKGSLGVEVPSGVFLEGGYTYIGTKLQGTDLSGFNVSLGYRF